MAIFHRFLTKYPHLFVYLTGGVQLDLHFSEKITIFADRFIVPKGLNRILEYNDETTNRVFCAFAALAFL